MSKSPSLMQCTRQPKIISERFTTVTKTTSSFHHISHLTTLSFSQLLSLSTLPPVLGQNLEVSNQLTNIITLFPTIFHLWTSCPYVIFSKPLRLLVKFHITRKLPYGAFFPFHFYLLPWEGKWQSYSKKRWKKIVRSLRQ